MSTRTVVLSPALLKPLPQGWSIKGYRELPTRDGVAFNCKLLIDGKVVGTIEQEGHGGGTHFFPDGPDYNYAAFNAEIAALYPTAEFMLTETVLNDLVEEHDAFRTFNRQSKTSTALIKTLGDINGEGKTEGWEDFGMGVRYWTPVWATVRIPLATFVNITAAQRKQITDEGFTHFWDGMKWSEL